jgi:hypothetical protein
MCPASGPVDLGTRSSVDGATQLAKSVARATILVVMCGAVALPAIASGGFAFRPDDSPAVQTSVTPVTTSAAVARQNSAPNSQMGTISGIVTDVKGDAVAAATVVLEDALPSDRRTVSTNENGFFELTNLSPGTRYHIAVSAKGFAERTSSEIIVQPGQVLDLRDVNLQIATVVTTVFAITSEQRAAQQVVVEEKQRVFGVIPAFYVVYNHDDAAPLTTKLKFKLALRTTVDPFTFFGAGFLAGIDQASDTPKYVQGAKGYGERVGAIYTNGFTKVLISGAVLPSLLHQDPRYFYQGTGTKKSRILHALSSPFICKGDNGRWQPNYSSMGGDLASSAISNAYYPRANRGLGLVLTGTLVSTGARMADTLMKEFILRKPTPN